MLTVEQIPARANRWRRLLAPPDPLLVDAGATGELIIAKVRLLVTGLLVLIPILNLPGAKPEETYVGFGAVLAALLLALILYSLVKRDLYRSWVGFTSALIDVTMISGVLVIFLLLGTPHTAVNSKVVFEVYFLAICATSLRYDVRICTVTGLLALCQYAAIVVYADSHWDLNNPSFAPFDYGMFTWGTQVSRLMLLLAATVLTTSFVIRAQRLRRLSTSDPLTELFNRGYFDERVVAEASRARRYKHPFALAMIDVDHFKPFNDTFGHAAGDRGLRTIAATISRSLRRTDIVARYGGDEFVVLLTETTAEAAVQKMESIRRAVAELGIELPRRSTTAGLTVSTGVASYPSDGVEVDDLLGRADQRLFEAKQGGRNKVVGPPAS